MSNELHPNWSARSHLPFYLTLASLFVAGTLYSIVRGSIHAGGFDLDALGVLLGTGITLALYSFLYGDNAFFKAAEHLYVGVGLGYQIVLAWFEYIKPEAYSQLLKYAVRDNVPGHPEWLLIPALVLSALLLLRFFPSLSWASRIPVAFIVGFTAATQAVNYIQSNILQQVQGTITPLTPSAAGGYGNLFGSVVILAGVVTVLLYFFFSIEHKGAVGVGSRIGMWFLMVAFGASYGYTVMGRMALLVGRIEFLIHKWLGFQVG